MDRFGQYLCSAARLADWERPFARAAAWSPDGQMIAYADGNDIFVVKNDGSEPRKLVSAPDMAFDPAWSPDGTVIRFRVGGEAALGVTFAQASRVLGSLWQVSVNGTNLHSLLPGWHTPPTECCGRWTADGKYFVFQSAGNIWALAEKGNWLGKASGQPFQLTSGPMTFSLPPPQQGW